MITMQLAERLAQQGFIRRRGLLIAKCPENAVLRIQCIIRRDRSDNRLLGTLYIGIRFQKIEELLDRFDDPYIPTISDSLGHLQSEEDKPIWEWNAEKPEIISRLLEEIQTYAFPFFEKFQDLQALALALRSKNCRDWPGCDRVLVMAAILVLKKGKVSAVNFLNREIDLLRTTTNPWDAGKRTEWQKLRDKIHCADIPEVLGDALFIEPTEPISILAPPPPDPLGEKFILSNEWGLRRHQPNWNFVEWVARRLDAGAGNSFCCLEALDGSYVQVLKGINGCHLEWRVMTGDSPNGYRHYRASYPEGATADVKLQKLDFVHSGKAGELLHVDDAIDCLRCFYYQTGLPVWLNWRVLEL